MANRHNRRQRKKLRIGEFQELGFSVSAALRVPLDDSDRDALIDVLLDDCIERNGLLFGGGINEMLDGFVTSDTRRGSATEQQRQAVLVWLHARPEFDAVTVGPLTDAWYGHN
ncbi:YggL 50S ribosome-binding family protein [Paraburkholderia solisilvae]